MSRAILRDTLVCPACEFPVWETDGWSAAHAGELTGIPARTVQDWRSAGFIGPTIEWPPGEGELFYGLRDLIALRCARELLDRRGDRQMASEVAREVAGRPFEWRRLATGEVWIVLPLCREAQARARDTEPQGALAGIRIEPPSDLPDDSDDGFTIWPLSDVAAELVEAADYWHLSYGIDRPPPWL